ncbi:MAG TPA: maltose ABC transporter substrate-binding protein [Actinomycetes bacterium]|nr:maltose ABC transporter substrate-binding protein [Actinomycetes bacterium]
MRVRRTTLALLMAGLMVLLAGCGSGGGASDSGSEGVSLTIWADDKYSRAIKESATKWGELNDVQVNVQAVSKDLQTVYVTAAQAGKGPDLVMGAHDWIGNLVQNGTVDPLQLTDDTRAAFNELALQGVTYNGQIYGIPYAIENVVLFRNTDLAPEAPKSLEELVAKGKELKATGKASEIMALPVGPNGDAYHMYPIYTSGGGYLFGKGAEGDYDPKDLGLSKPEAAKAFEKIGELGEKGDGALKRSISPDNVTSLFTGKKTAFLLSGPWQIPDVEKSGVPYEITPIPGFQGGKEARPFVGVQAMYVASQGRFKSLAQEFATNYFIQPEVAVALYKADRRPPPLKAAFEEVSKTNPDMAKILEAGKNGDIMPAIPEMATVWDPLGKAQSATVGGASPSSTVAAAAKAIEGQIK